MEATTFCASVVILRELSVLMASTQPMAPHALLVPLESSAHQVSQQRIALLATNRLEVFLLVNFQLRVRLPPVELRLQLHQQELGLLLAKQLSLHAQLDLTAQEV